MLFLSILLYAEYHLLFAFRRLVEAQLSIGTLMAN